MARRGRSGFKAVGLIVMIAACAARPVARGSAAVRVDEDEVWLYRDQAVVRQRVDVVAAARGKVTVPVRVAAADLDLGEIVVLGAGGDVKIEKLGRRIVEDPEAGPAAIAVTLDAPRAGRFVVELGYATSAIGWKAHYVVTRETGLVRGELAIRNRAGVALTAHVRVVDDGLGSLRSAPREALRKALAGKASDVPARDLGRLELGEAVTRQLIAARRTLAEVMVLDVIGRGLDHPGAAPAAEPGLGAATRSGVKVAACVEVAREVEDRGLPGGPAEVVAGGVVIGKGRMFDAATRLARGETIVVGEAPGLVATRARRDWAKDDDRRRLSEELLVTIESVRTADVEVVVREHLYRGQNWTLAYQSTKAIKEGAQQIGFGVVVPAKGAAKVLYVVVYTW